MLREVHPFAELLAAPQIRFWLRHVFLLLHDVNGDLDGVEVHLEAALDYYATGKASGMLSVAVDFSRNAVKLAVLRTYSSHGVGDMAMDSIWKMSKLGSSR